jgi:hypothetical protein
VAALGPVLLVAAIIAARNPPALFRAEFWAEDATEFFFGALELGAASVATPVYGYHFLLSRLVAYFATFAPVFYTPYVYAWASLIINAVSVAYITRPGFSWIAPQPLMRLLLAALLATGPGTSEAFLNLANVPNVIALLGLLILIERPFVVDWKKFVALILLALSSGQMVLWVPVVLYLAWVKRSRAHALLGLALAMVGLLNIIGSRQASSDAHLLADAGTGVIVRIMIENAFTRLLPGPLLGSGLSRALMLSSPALFWSTAVAGFIAVATLVVRESRRDPTEILILMLAYAGAIGGLGVVALSRNYAIPLLVRESGSILPDIRYSVLSGAVALILWAWWLLRLRTSRLPWTVARVVASCAIVVNVAAHWGYAFTRPDLQWAARSEPLQWLLDERDRTGKAVIIRLQDLPVHPVGWIPGNDHTSVVLQPK